MSEPTTFLSRVYDAKHRFEVKYLMEPTQLFLGPKERLELKEYVAELERAGLLARTRVSTHHEILSGMTIIVLASDGMRAGVSSI